MRLSQRRHWLFVAAACLTIMGVATPTVCQSQRPPRWQLVQPVELRASEMPGEGFGRVVGAVRLPHGEVVVADAATQELLVFDAKGAFVKSLSRRGQGPGELTQLALLSHHADTVIAIERAPGPNQVHRFLTDRGFLNRELLQSKDSLQLLGTLAYLPGVGYLAARGGMRPINLSRRQRVWRDTLRIGLLPRDLRGVRWLGRFAQSTMTTYSLPSGPTRTGATQLHPGPSLVLGATDGRIWIADSERGRITSVDSLGRSGVSIEWPAAARPLNAAALRQAAQRLLGDVRSANDSARLHARFGLGLSLGDAPHFTRFVPTVGTELWVEAFTEDPDAAKRYLVFGADGRWRAVVDLSRGTSVLYVGRDQAIVSVRDEDDVTTLQVYHLKR